MTGPQRRLKAVHLEIGLFLVLMAGGLFLAWHTSESEVVLNTEAVIRVGVARDLLHGFPRGRQGLVGSLEWAPLPTLLLMPTLRLPAPFGGDWAPVMVALTAAAFLSVFLSAWLGRCGVGRFLRLGVSLAFFLSPAVQKTVLAGSAEPIFWLTIFATVCFLMHWLETEALRSLAYLSLALALAVATRYQAAMLFLVTGLFVVLHLCVRRQRKSYAEATLIVFLVPGLYVLLLWLTTNWLIMGNAFFFLRGLFVEGALWQGAGRVLDNVEEWGHVALLVILSLAVWWMRGLNRLLRGAATVAVVLAVCVPIWYGPYGDTRREERQRRVETEAVARDLAADYKEDWIVYSGYLGYEFSRPHDEPRVEHVYHTLSFYLDPTLADTRGKRTYILAPRAKGYGCWEDVNLKYPEMFSQGTYFTVFERRWENWQLFRVVRMDGTDRSYGGDIAPRALHQYSPRIGPEPPEGEPAAVEPGAPPGPSRPARSPRTPPAGGIRRR